MDSNFRTYVQVFYLSRILFICFVLCTASFKLLATHVVGGEMKYDYLGADSYYVELRMYVDCENGSKAAISQDSTGHFGVFVGLTMESYDRYELFRGAPSRLSKVNYSCVIPPENVCVDMYTYDTIMVLPENETGYYISYQRCCRNHSILNLDDPGGTGSTYVAYIPSRKEVPVNSNPRFKKLPPNYLCINERFDFDHSATDPDGDSLVYKICSPYNGADRNTPKPYVPSNPPYKFVNWLFPYNETDPMPVANNFKIDPVTGRLGFKPNRLGQYVFGVCVEEYRNGEFIAQTIRDYQFNVMDCSFQVKSRFEGPDFSCDPEVSFENNSLAATGYFWDFGEPDVTSDTSNAKTPDHTYTSPGKYTVMLVAKNGNCADTSYHIFDVFSNGLRENNFYNKCDYDTVLIRSKGLYGAKGVWESTSDFVVVSDTSLKYGGGNKAVFVIKYDTNGCVLVDSHHVSIIEPKPQVDILEDAHCLGIDFTVELTDSLQFGNPSWFYQDSDGKDFVVTGGRLTKPLLFNEQLGIALRFNYLGCEDTFVYQLESPEMADFEVSRYNVITPNDDGFNDCFPLKVKGIDIACRYYELTIYNRWGEKVYIHEDHSVEPCWEGDNYVNGRLCPAGTYFYFAKIESVEFYGSISLLR